MAPAAAPPHRGQPAGQAGPGRWPDRQGAGRLASPGAAASRLGRSYGRGGWEAAPAGGRAGARGRLPRPGGLASRSVHRGSAQAREPGRPRLRPRRRPPFQQRCPASGGSSSFVWVRGPAGVRWPHPHPGSATAAAGGDGRRWLSSSSPHPRLSGAGPPESPPEGPGDRPACASEERTALGRTQGRPPPPPPQPPQRPKAAYSGPQRRRLGPPPGPRAHYPVAERNTEHARRGGSGAGPARGREGA